MSTRWQWGRIDPETTSAILIIAAVYGLRIQEPSPPWYLGLATDLLLPTIAATWLYVVAIYVAITTYDHRH